MNNIKTWQERMSEDDKFKSTYTYMQAEIAELRAALDVAQKNIEQAARLSRNWTLEYAAMHFDGLEDCSGCYAAECMRELKKAPIDVTPIMEAIEKGQGK